MKTLLMCMVCVLVSGCANLGYPKFKSDEVHCIYDRVSVTIEWKCNISGSGELKSFDIF